MIDLNGYKELDLSGYDILIVDDTPVNVILIQKMLSRFSFKTDTAYNGGMALKKIDESIANGKRYSMVLLDLRMPGLSGFDVLARIKDMPQADGMPVIVLSGLADSESLSTAMQLGAVGYLQKPIFMDSLYQSIFQYLGLQSA